MGRRPERYRFNPDIRANQVLSFLVARYRGLDRTTVASHMNRYMTIKEFLDVYRDRLVADHLMLPGDGTEEGVASRLIEVLVEAPFAATHTNIGGHEVPTFDYAAVTAEARRRIDAEEADGGGDDESSPREGGEGTRE